MSVKTDGVARSLAQRTEAAAPAAKTIAQKIEELKPQLARALPKHLSADRLVRVALTTLRLNPKLQECKAESLMGALMQAGALGLEPGVLGHCYLVPYGSECTLIVGYRGMIDLARRSGQIQTVYARIVHDGDVFHLRYGLDEALEHVPWHAREDEDRPEHEGAVRGAYLVARFKDGGYLLHYLPLGEIEKHRKRSRAATSGPWVSDFEAMCLKTVVRDAWKWLPISVEIAEATVAADDSTHSGIEARDMADVVDATATTLSAAAEEVAGEPEEPAPDAPQQRLPL